MGGGVGGGGGPVEKKRSSENNCFHFLFTWNGSGSDRLPVLSEGT